MKPKIFEATDHDIEPHLIDRDAIYVINRLNQAGHKAYLVGGSVRDLLAKVAPKDFDISTSAKPEEIKAIFGRQCLLIGRRFRLAHIRFGHKVIEVATFRTGEGKKDELIREDNVWGTPEEDVLRRDFTINGLFYDPNEHVIIDYVGGWEDIHAKIIRTIGDPENRFKQDPVRMIRLLKFRARFRFEIVTETKVALLKCLPEIVKSSPARVLEELFRMLESGSSAPFFQLMLESRLLEPLFPRIAEFMKGENGNKIFDLLIAADEINRTAGKKPLDRSQLLSCLLFPIFEAELKAKFLDKGVEPHLGQIQFASYDVIEEYILTAYNHFPRRISSMAAILMTNQFRLHPISGKKHFPQRFIRSRDFPDALLFLKIRATQDPSLTPLFNEWREHYQPHHHPPQRRPRHNAHRHS